MRLQDWGLRAGLILLALWRGERNMNVWLIFGLCLYLAYKENFGMIVPEALICGTSVYASLGTPWGELRLWLRLVEG